MIGVFDSGFGGLVILRELDKQFPGYDFVYLGDNARAPYGTRTKEEVYQFTLEAVEYLLGRGCELVILACNTASANALRRIQQEVLPAKYPGKRVLGILVPTIEQVTGVDWASESTEASTRPHKIAIFATPSTVSSNAYSSEIKKRNPSAEVFQIACPNLATLIESDGPGENIEQEIRVRVDELKKTMGESYPPDAVLLGCTHYPLAHDVFARVLPEGAHVYDQGSMVATSLRNYLAEHSEIDEILGKNSKRIFLTTGEPKSVEKMASRFYGKDIAYEHVTLTTAL